MALSNIFREPKRELIEQGFGLVVFSVFAAVDVLIAKGLYVLCGFKDGVDFFFCTVLLAPAAMAGIFGCLLIMHHFGEEVCGAMKDRGFDPRPRNRP